jgi:uncharacterized cofD-like protein
LERRDPKGDPAGNLLLADLEQKTGSFQTAIDTLRQQFNVPYQIFPLTEVSPVLHSESESGKVIDGQRNIVQYTWNHPEQSLAKLWITPADAQLSPGARTALRQADVIIIPVGDIYSSIAPAFCVRELIELWLRLSPQVVWLPNFIAAPGRNKYASASGALDFYHMLNPGFHPAKIIAHDGTLTEAETERIRQRKYTISPLDLDGPGTALIKSDLLDHAYAPPTANQGDIVERSPIRYDSLKLHNIFKEILG